MSPHGVNPSISDQVIMEIDDLSPTEEFTHSTSQVRARVKFESRAKFESGSIFSFFDLFSSFISYGCYFRLHNDVLVVNRKNYKCLVCNIPHY